MSVRVIDWVWRNAPYRASQLLVLLAMADWADDAGGNVFPLVTMIAMKARLAERATQYAIVRLERDGMIRRDALGGTHGRDRARWQIVMERAGWPTALRERIDAFAGDGVSSLDDDDGGSSRVQALAPVVRLTGASRCTPRVHNRAKSATVSILDPSVDPSLKRGRLEKATAETERRQRQGELAGLVARLTGTFKRDGV